MPKNLFQDMVRAKNSKKVFIPEKETPKVEIPRKELFQYPDMGNFGQPDRKQSHYGLWFVALISIMFFIFALSFLFARAQITVIPKTDEVVLKENLSAVKDINSNGLAFDLVIISGEEVKKVTATEAKDLSLSAKGSVFIYNTFSSAPQNLAENTKLEGSNGKIYKTTDSVVVPGIDEEGAAGSVEVGISAVEPGAEYNSTPLDFKIQGFKGTPKYSKFYARSKGNIGGGFKGNSPSVSDTEKEAIFAELKMSLKEKLFRKATEQIPAGFILFKDAAFLTVDEESVQFSSTETDLPLLTKGTLYGFLFNEKELTQKIAKDNIPNYDDSEVYILNIKDLVFSLTDEVTSFTDIQNINFNLSGNAKFVWKFDDVKFSESLLGKSKKDFNQILSDYPHIDSAQLTLSPFWIRSLPGKLKDIKVIVNYPKQ